MEHNAYILCDAAKYQCNESIHWLAFENNSITDFYHTDRNVLHVIVISLRNGVLNVIKNQKKLQIKTTYNLHWIIFKFLTYLIVIYKYLNEKFGPIH